MARVSRAALDRRRGSVFSSIIRGSRSAAVWKRQRPATHASSTPRRLSKAALETLAIVAYHQPVTRADIEMVRGVQASKGTLDALLELGLVRMRGRRRSPGRPITYGTTDAFLEHYGMASLADLPGATEMKAAGLLDLDLPADFAPPDPNRAAADEDPLDETDTPEFHQDYIGGAES